MLIKISVPNAIIYHPIVWIALLGLLTASPAWAWVAADKTPQTQRTCRAIAALANRGAQALRGQDLVGRNVSVDLRNDGHPTKIEEVGEGSAGWLSLHYVTGEPVPSPTRNDFGEAGRWASNQSVLRIGRRFWEVDWDVVALEDSVALLAASDGTAVCFFHSEAESPTIKLFSGGDPKDIGVYKDILMGHGAPAPSAGVDTKRLEEAWKAPHFEYHVGSLSWRIDLTGGQEPMTLVQADYLHFGGAGCERTDLALVQHGAITAIGLARNWNEAIKPLMPTSPDLAGILDGHDGCQRIVETPIMGPDNRVYVLISNTYIHHTDTTAIQLLAGARRGVMHPLARLSWKRRNYIVDSERP